MALKSSLVALFLSAAMTTNAIESATTFPKSPEQDRPQDLSLDLQGPIHQRIEGVINNWLLKVPGKNPAIVGMFRDRDKQPLQSLLPWSGEFAGKYLTASVEVYRVTHDQRLKQEIQKFVDTFISYQDTNGYLGPFDKEHRLTGKAPNAGDTWDVWGHYHAMMGLMSWYDESGDAKALNAAKKIGDLLCEKYAGPKTIAEDGSAEMNQAAVHSLAILYKKTGEKKYLDLAEEIVQEFSHPNAGDYLQTALDGKEFFQSRKPRWESLHPIMGLAELYYITGKDDYRKAFEHLWWSIAKLDRHNNGGFSSGEQAHGDPYHRGAIETCCTIAWMAMSVEMLRMSGDPRVADELELSTLNQVVGLHMEDGSMCTYNTPMEGIRIASIEDISFQVRPGSEQLNCCSVNAARGYGLLSAWAMQTKDDGIVLNWYGAGTMAAKFKGTDVKLTQETSYPGDGHITLKVDPSSMLRFKLNLRIPHWSKTSKVSVNGEAVTVTPGTYAEIDRDWKPGDSISIDLDMSPRYWVGERAYAGKASIYRGPILLTLESKAASPAFSKEFYGSGFARVTNKAGGSVEYHFAGDRIRWNGLRYDDAGMARVLIDGKEVDVVDQYGPGRDLPFSWERSGLGDGEHLLRLEVLGKKRDESKDTWINVQGFEPEFNPPQIDLGSLSAALAKPSGGERDLLFTLKDTAGKDLVLRDYGSAGRERVPYTTWLRVRKVAPIDFSQANPSRTQTIAK